MSCIHRNPKLLPCLFSEIYSISFKVKEWPLLQEQFSETACLSNGFSAFIKTIYFHWTLQDKHQSQEECKMKFIITLQKQILGSFYFAQVKKVFSPLPTPKETKVVMGEEVFTGLEIRKLRGFPARGALQGRPQSLLTEQWKLKTQDSLSDGWQSVRFLFFSYRAIKAKKIITQILSPSTTGLYTNAHKFLL